MPQVKPDIETFAKIKVIGIGGAGGSAVNRMIKEGIRGVEFVAMNTDIQDLHHNSANYKIHIGKTITRGLGAGMDPEVGKKAAEESQKEIQEMLKGTDMVFVTCGLGGGTGSGASPIIANIARECGALAVGVVTKPFMFEGAQRMSIAEKAHRELSENVDTIITIPNERVLQIIDKKTGLVEAFRIVDDVLRQGVQGISELITVPGLVNVDFADVKSIMKDQGSALMGIGIGSGENRAIDAARAAISSPLLELSIDGARGILFTVTGSSNLGMQEIAEAAKVITGSTDENSRVIFGTVIDENMGDSLKITVIATGFEGQRRKQEKKEADLLKSPFGGKASTQNNHAPSPKLFYGTSLFRKKEAGHEVARYNDFELDSKTSESAVQKENNKNQDDDLFFTSKNVGEDSFKPLSAPSKKNENKDEGKDNDNDLEIPAFIRRKMGL